MLKLNSVGLIIFLCLLQSCFGFLNEININDDLVIDSEKYANDDPCRICEQIADNVISLRKSNSDRDVMIDYLNRLCKTYTDWGTTACAGLVNIEIDTVLYIIHKRKNLTPARFCAIRFQQYNCVDPDAEPWSIPLPPLPLGPQRKTTTKNASEIMEVLHITDMHFDPMYTPGSKAKCNDPLCCESGTPAKKDDAAGYWADYNVCDMPWHSVENLMERIKSKHEHIDWIYFTGDIVSHRSWATSIPKNRETIRTILQLFAKTFPTKTVFPILGNHESHPVDYFAPDYVDKTLNVSTQWIFDLSVVEWARWLPNNTQTTIQKGGYYTVLVKPGFRIVALNSNVCFTFNLWLVYDDRDPYNQLQWLVDVLEKAEKNGEKVHILSHVPSGEVLCHKRWSHEFKKIVLRFSHTIAAQFNGHTHYDEFKLFFDSRNPREGAKSVAYNGASFTTFVGFNPNYRIYEVDNQDMMVIDYDEYIFNVTQANKNTQSPPEWTKLYSFKEAYGLPDLQLSTLGKLYQEMTSNGSDNAIVDKYYRYMNRDSDVYNKQGCDSKCKKNLVCTIAVTESSDSFNC